MKPINYLAQTGALEDLIWSIMNDAETEAHADRLRCSFLRDLENSEDVLEKDLLAKELSDLDNLVEAVREIRYLKTKIALTIAEKTAKNKQQDKYSCMFKHQLLSLAEMRDCYAVLGDETALEAYRQTANNASIAISKFLGLEVENCIACLFEKNKIEVLKNMAGEDN
ncbi:hypothetical protein FI615_001709 [Enterococcus faecium]|uniref:hypothetical protein n=1 Tax=Enterococcus faecium TaxID=1352 RepID=UPI0019230B48|nr:hypothetical protein [Enterococcus faecium]EGP4894222.1 hypothetical protein [Enterococcus faecium]EHK9936778.1 hypothetical protein [Enterococcus faecium]MBL3708370.1 hypothetical protein [Enterococcus faecium]